MEKELRFKIAEALEALLSGDLNDRPIRDLMVVLPKSERDSYGAEALHQAMHFISDNDLRERDSEYDDYLRDSLKEYVERLRLQFEA